jgi:hypothetical protein
MGLVARGRDNNLYIIIAGEHDNEPPERPRHRWEDNIIMDFKEIGCECGLDPVVHF